MRQRWWRRAKEKTAVVGPREMPELHSGGAEVKLDCCLVQ
jgi:hypothetical protein